MQTASNQVARMVKVIYRFKQSQDRRKAKRFCNILGSVVRASRIEDGSKFQDKALTQNLRKASVNKMMITVKQA